MQTLENSELDLMANALPTWATMPSILTSLKNDLTLCHHACLIMLLLCNIKHGLTLICNIKTKRPYSLVAWYFKSRHTVALCVWCHSRCGNISLQWVTAIENYCNTLWHDTFHYILLQYATVWLTELIKKYHVTKWHDTF